MHIQHHPRYKKRVPCEFHDDKGRHVGMVLNMSQTGLFVSSRATPPVGSRVTLKLAARMGSEAQDVPARVVWKRKVHGSTHAEGNGGIGLEIVGLSDRYDRFIQNLIPEIGEEGVATQAGNTSFAERATAAAAVQSPTAARAVQAAALLPKFRVRAALIGTPRTKVLELCVADAAEACERATIQLGGDWEVREVVRCTPVSASNGG